MTTMQPREFKIPPGAVREWPSIEDQIELRAALRTLLPQDGWQLIKLDEGCSAFGPPVCPWCHRPPGRGRFSIIQNNNLNGKVSVCPTCTAALTGMATEAERKDYKSRTRPLIDGPDEYFSDNPRWSVTLGGDVRFTNAWNFIDIQPDENRKWSWDGFFLGVSRGQFELHFDSFDGCLEHVVLEYERGLASWIKAHRL